MGHVISHRSQSCQIYTWNLFWDIKYSTNISYDKDLTWILLIAKSLQIDSNRINKVVDRVLVLDWGCKYFGCLKFPEYLFDSSG